MGDYIIKTAEKCAQQKGMGWRVVDRRLQALRKAGKIKYSLRAGGWSLA